MQICYVVLHVSGVVHPPDAIHSGGRFPAQGEECGFQCFDCQQVEQCCKPFFLPLLRSFPHA
ncbi:hypothetical protein CYE02_28735 (plasmid) [Klebsiella pneumoniae]|nr:hypothetical protein CYE02_28735 [Klebsiella pneumoniae]EPB34568.1 hypothetical protein H216_5660 [Klebsiella pneumoniae DMC0526]